METTTAVTGHRTIKLPGKHASDWVNRIGRDDLDVEVLAQSKRTITLRLTDEALCDLIGDAIYYAEEMGPDNTGDDDYRPAARRLLGALDRQGVRYTHRQGTFMVTLASADA
jgi:hypothetical protein